MTKILLIANPKSGTINFDNAINTVNMYFKEFSVESTLIKTDYNGHAVDIVKNQNLTNFDSVCAMGGDGTLFEVLNGMLSKSAKDRIPISVIPNGTGNSFMKTVGTTKSESAVKIIAANSSRKIDVMKASCDQKDFFSLNLIGWGMATDISLFAEKLRVFGGQRYNIASFFEIIKNKRRVAKITIDGVEREGDFAFIIACNTKYVGKDMKMAPNAIIDDGLIDLIIVKKASSLTLFSVFPKLFDGSHIEHDACEYVQCKSFSIDPDDRGKLNIDGEITGTSPVSVALIKGGVELII
jgi:YegS/Rv2252/BmrU family lipid kinase